MNPQKKGLQIELAKEIMLAEITGRRSNGQAGGMNYFDLFQEAMVQAIDIVDTVEKEVVNNQIAWEQYERYGLGGSDEDQQG